MPVMRRSLAFEVVPRPNEISATAATAVMRLPIVIREVSPGGSEFFDSAYANEICIPRFTSPVYRGLSGKGTPLIVAS